MKYQDTQLRSMLGQSHKIIARLIVLGVSFSCCVHNSLLGQELVDALVAETTIQPFLDQEPDVSHSGKQVFATSAVPDWFERDHTSECALCNDRYPTGHLSGFLQVDSAGFDQSTDSVTAFGVINDKTAVRRARLALIGEVAQDIGYKLDVDFAASGHPSARDVFIDFNNRPIADRLVFGNTKVPFQLEALTSSKDFTFAERAPFFTFAPFRQVGIWADGRFEDEMGTWSIAGFRVGKGGFVLNHADDGHGFAARSTVLHWYEDEGRYLLHTGVNYSYMQPFDKSVRYDAKLSFFTNQEPGIISPGVPVLVDTGTIPAEGVNLFNFELAGTMGWLNYQSELTYALVDQIGGPPLMFYGGYGQIGWFLTGESKSYNRKTGVYGSVVPAENVCDGGLGAWELALRGTYLNLNDENITGGRLNTFEFGMNWYLSQHLSIKFNYVRGFVNNVTTNDVALDTYGARLQIIY
ncbi:porin [uncultured Gimesia sp.]|uniref:OprO/OprP family phosphate-selective porin n=1 Tax=uncultured Gimesia sp. TaxID=1678688 RepID=UPI00260BF643|nr:porin [uncultured Gimesia sp.]